MYFEFEWGSIFMLKKSINRLLFSIIIFLCFISHLLQFWTYKQLLYTKLEEMLYGFCRTWPFLAICYRAWAIGLEASPLFYCPLLIHVVNFPQTLTFWGLESIHNIYNVPSEPERGGRRREAPIPPSKAKNSSLTSVWFWQKLACRFLPGRQLGIKEYFAIFLGAR